MRGKPNPLIENAVPVTLACEIVIVDAPLLVNVANKLLELPTCVLLNERLDGDAASSELAGATAVPVTGMLKLEFEALEVRVTLPPAAPLAVGEKTTLKDAL